MIYKQLKISQLLLSHLLPASIFSFYGVTNFCIANSLATTNTAKLNQWEFNPKSQKLEITLSATTKPEYFYLHQPPRLVVDLPNTQLGNVDTKKTYPGTMQKVRVSQFTSNITRIVIDLEPGTSIDINKVNLQPLSNYNPTRWVISSPLPNHKKTQNLLSPDLAMTLPPPATNLPTNLQPFVIVPPPNSQSTNQIYQLNIIPADATVNNNMVQLPKTTANSIYKNQQILEIPIILFGQPLPLKKSETNQ
ncbi:MAG: AMIN domain-containing protein [Sphaerospermopsis sp. SIO1G2]|nr:AMIN domain-containing protein [Sphaerospermopsis sp. SIO1G2]